MNGENESERPRVPLGESLRILFAASWGFWLVNFVNFGDGIAYFGMLALMTLFMEHDVGLSAGWATASIGLFTGAVTLFMAAGGGVVSDRLGVRRALTACLVVLLVGRVLYVSAAPLGSGAVLVASLGLLIMALGEGIIQPALYSGVKEYTDSRTETLGYAFLYSIMNLGIVAAEWISPLVREFWATRIENQDVQVNPTAGISGSFWFFIGVTAILLVVNLTLFTRKVEERDRLLVRGGTDSDEAFSWSAYVRDLPILDLRFLFFIFVLLPVRTLFAHQWLTMPGYVTRAFPAEVGARWEWINSLNPLVIVIFVPLFALLTRTRRVVDMMIVGTAVSAFSTFMLVGAPDTRLLIAYVVVFSLGEALWSSRFLEYVADIAPAQRVGIYMGIAGIPWFLAKTITGTYAGTLLDRFVPLGGPQDPGAMWLIYGVTALVSPLGLIAARGWLLRGVREDGVG